MKILEQETDDDRGAKKLFLMVAQRMEVESKQSVAGNPIRRLMQ